MNSLIKIGQVRVGEMIDGRYCVAVIGLIALASAEAIRFGISERFQSKCEILGNLSTCDVDHSFTFTVDPEIGSLDVSTEATVEAIVYDIAQQLNRARMLALI